MSIISIEQLLLLILILIILQVKSLIYGKKRMSLTRFIEHIVEKWIERSRGTVVTPEHAILYAIMVSRS